MKRALAFVPIPALFLVGACVARATLRFAPARIAPDRAQPALVVTAWGTYGAVAFAILASTIALATLALIAALWLTRTQPLSTADLLVLVLASFACCAAWPYLFSSDTYAYAAYGDLALRGSSPYAVAPATLHDAILDAARYQWSGPFPPCVYGPAFVMAARAVVWVTRAFDGSVAATLWTFRASACAAYAITIVCADFALRSLARERRARILVLGALNPVALWTVAEGHNDAYALLVASVVAALGSLDGGMRRVAGLPLAMLVKASAGILAIASFFDELLVRRRATPRVALALLCGTLVTAALLLPPLLPALRIVAAHGRYAPAVSVAQIFGPWPTIALASALAAIALALLLRGSRGGHGWLGLAALAAVPNPYPWYGLLLLPLALADDRARPSRSLYALTICTVIRYLPDAYGDMSPSTAIFASAVTIAPIAFALIGLRTEFTRLPKDRQPQ